jgi:hypothetical protein
MVRAGAVEAAASFAAHGSDETADHALAVICLEAIDARVLSRQPVPDRQQEAGDDVKAALGEFRHLGAFGFPQRCKFRRRDLPPVRVLDRSRVTVSRAIGRISRVRA